MEIAEPLVQNSGLPGVAGKTEPVRMHGASLLPLMKGEIAKVRDYAFSGHHVGQWAIRDQQWTYLMPLDNTTLPQLYFRAEDPTEQHNLIEGNQDIADRLELALRRHVDSL